MRRRRPNAVAATGCAVLVALSLPFAGPAFASPDVPDQLPAQDVVVPEQVVRRADGVWVVPLSLTAAGADEIRFSGETGRTSIELPVPDGLRPLALDGAIVTSSDITGGSIEYDLAGAATRVVDIGSPPNPDGSVAESNGPQDSRFDLAGATTVDGRLSVRLAHSLFSDNGFCQRRDTGGWAEFRGVLLLEGEPTTPNSVAEFATPLLERLEIVVPDDASIAEAEAAVRVGTSMRRASLNPGVVIDVVSEPATAASADNSVTTRRIVIERDSRTGAFLANDGDIFTLVMAAPDEAGRRLVTDSVVGEVGSVALVSEFDVDGGDFTSASDGATTGSDQQILEEGSTETHQFVDLDLVRARRSGLGVMTERFATDQTRLGGPVASADVSIHVTHTQAPETSAAVASVAVNGVLLSSRPLEGTSTNFDFTIDESSIVRNLSFEMVVDYAPPTGRCRPRDIEFSWQIDPNLSTIEVRGGQTIDPGFGRFPQNLINGVLIGLDDTSPLGIEVATRLGAAIDRSGSQPILMSVVSINDAVAAEVPAIIVDRSGRVFDTMDALIGLDPLRVRDELGRFQSLRLSTDDALAVLQAWTFENRDLMAVSWQAESPESTRDVLSRLLDQLDGQRTSFASLSGDVLVVSEDSTPANLSIVGASTVDTPERTAPAYRKRILSIVGIVAVCVFIALAAWTRRQMRRDD